LIIFRCSDLDKWNKTDLSGFILCCEKLWVNFVAMNIYLDSIGCRLNQSEIENYAIQFRAAGHNLVATPDTADLVVLNTCTVTSAAASASRQKIRQVKRAGVDRIVVTGCWSTLNPVAAAALPGVSELVPNQVKDQLVANVLQLPEESFNLEPILRQPIPGARMRTRAFIKVQDGCDNHCTFCITTLARGAGRSRPVEEVLRDIRLATGAGDELSQPTDKGRGTPMAGAQEVVLTGVHLGSWGQDLNPPQHLSDLIRVILERSGVPRLRLSSLEPWDLDDSFFTLWDSPRLCRHLHLPLQSGSAGVLRRMARKTTPAAFARLVAAARRIIPDIAITTDIIVGFPGESQAEFAESLAFVQSMQFARGHVFTYSSRPGTTAVRMPEQVPHARRKERNAHMRAVLAESEAEYMQRFVGRRLPVLWESTQAYGPQGWELRGLTDNYLRVSTHAPQRLWNRITPVELTSLESDSLYGTIVE
jgi:threonylcarbamoyladenosine tRNA methylthiotransferase MtaB